MRVQELIRGILDLIDGEESAVQVAVVPDEPEAEIVAGPNNVDDIRRFRQIVDLASDNTDGTNSVFSNAPDEKVASIDAVTIDAGGGANGPKHPADIKSNSISMYPNFLAKDDEHGC